jgi:hypothetical protein
MEIEDMSKEIHEALGLILQTLHLANPNPVESAPERVELLRELLDVEAGGKMGSDEAAGLLIDVLKIADPNPAQRAQQCVERIRGLLGTKKTERKEKSGYDRIARGGRDREG